MAASDPALASAVAAALAGDRQRPGPPWILVALAGSVLEKEGREHGLQVLGEAFADRSYRRDGTLMPRSAPGSVIKDAGEAARQALRIARDGMVQTADGSPIHVEAGTICIHGDNPAAAEFARRIRAELASAGIAVRASRGA
jgi:UPF0271 protein